MPVPRTGKDGDTLLEKGGMPRSLTTEYRVMRFCERCPHIAPTPKHFYTALTDDERCYYLGYEIVREAQEARMRIG